MEITIKTTRYETRGKAPMRLRQQIGHIVARDEVVSLDIATDGTVVVGLKEAGVVYEVGATDLVAAILDHHEQQSEEQPC